MAALARLRSLLIDDSGQGLVEYALILALVAIAAIGALKVVATRANSTLSGAALKMS